MKKLIEYNSSKPIGIYIHVPFCRGKCPYCDFYSISLNEDIMNAYVNETICRLRELSEYKLSADTVYFGGGTPSLLGKKNISRIMQALYENIDIMPNAEITVEANPSSDLTDFLEGCALSGINRLSLGMQSAVEKELKAIGRKHMPDDILHTMDISRRLGIENISLDLMLGIPLQTPDSLDMSLKFIEQAQPEHVSAYMLKLEEGTPFYKNRSSLILPDDDAMAELYEQAFGTLDLLGYKQYEISNCAKEDKFSRHNVKYWNCDEYIGIGPAAHGFIGGYRYFFDRDINNYLNGCEPNFDCIGGSYEEYIMLRLRLSDGLDEGELIKRFNRGFSQKAVSQIEYLIKCNLLARNETTINLTRTGMLVSNFIIGMLLE